MRLSGLAPRRLQAHADLPFTQLWFKFCKGGSAGSEEDDHFLRTLVDSVGEYERRSESGGSLTISLRLSVFSLATLQRAGARREGCTKKLFTAVQHIMGSCVNRLRELGATCEAMDKSTLTTVISEALGAMGIFVEVLSAVVAVGPLPAEGVVGPGEASSWGDLMPGIMSLATAYFEAILLVLGSNGLVGGGSSSSGSGGFEGSGGELDAQLAKHRTALWRLLSAAMMSQGTQSHSHSQFRRLAELCSLLLRRLDMKQIQRLGLEAFRARPGPGESADSGAGATRLFELFCLSSLQQCLDGAPGSTRAALLSSMGASSQEWCSHVARVMNECHALITAMQTPTASAMSVDGDSDGDGNRQYMQSTRNALLRLLTAAVHGGVPYSKTILPQLAKLKRLAAEIRGALKSALQSGLGPGSGSDAEAVLASVALDLEAVQLLVGMDHQLVAYTSGEAQDGTEEDVELLPRQREFRLLFGHSSAASARGSSEAVLLCSAQRRLLGTLVGVHTELRRVEEMVRDLAAMSNLPALSRLLGLPAVQSLVFNMMRVPSNQLEALWACLPVDSLAELGGQRALLGVLVGNVLHATRRDSPWRPFAAISPALEQLSLEMEQGQGGSGVRGGQSDALVGLAHLLRLAAWALSREEVDVYAQPFIGRLYARVLCDEGSEGQGARIETDDSVGAGGAVLLPLQLSMAALLLNAAGRCYAAPVPAAYSVQEVRRRLSLAVGRACVLGSAESVVVSQVGSSKGKKRKSSGQGAVQASEDAGSADTGLVPLVLPLLQSFSVWGEMADLCPPAALGRAIFQALRADASHSPTSASTATSDSAPPRAHGRLRLELSRTALQDSALLQAALSAQVSSALADTLQSLRAAAWTRPLLAAALAQLELLDAVPRRLWFAVSDGGERAALQASLLPGLAEVLLRAGQASGEQGQQCVTLVRALSSAGLDLLRGGDLPALAAMLSAESMQALAQLGLSPAHTSAGLLGWLGALLRAATPAVVLAVLDTLAEAGLGKGPVCPRALCALLRDASGNSRAQSLAPPAPAGLVLLCSRLAALAAGAGPLGLTAAPEALWALAKVPTEHNPEAAAVLDSYCVSPVELDGAAIARRWVQLVGTMLHIYHARGRGLTRGERGILLGRLSEAFGWYCADELKGMEGEGESTGGRPEASMAIVGLLLTAPDPPARSQVLDALRSCSLQPGAAWLAAQAGHSVLEAVVAAGCSRGRGHGATATVVAIAGPLADSARLVSQAASRASVYEEGFGALCGALADTLQYGLGVLRMQGPGGVRGTRGGGTSGGSGGSEGSEAMWATLCVDVTATLAARMTARAFPGHTHARLWGCTRGLLLVLEQLVASRSALLRTSLGAFAACLAQLVHWVVQAHRPALKNGTSTSSTVSTSSSSSSSTSTSSSSSSSSRRSADISISDLLDAVKRVFNAVAVSKELQQCCGLLATSTLQLLAACGGAEHSALEALLQGVSVLLARCNKRQRLQVHDLLGADARILYADLSRDLGVGGRIVL